MLNRFKLLIWRIAQLISDLLLAIVFRGPNNALVPIREDCLLESATTLASRIRRGRITSEDALQACIRRIEDINGTSNCVVENRFEDALREAQEIDRFISEGTKTTEQIEKDTPFLGVPFTVKDGIGIKGVKQAAGVVARRNEKATEDAEAVALLRAAGAIPLATTNIPELSSWWETNNKLYGRTTNPYHSQRIPGGSSGGEAAILAACGSFMGLGTDIGGSVRIPAHFCGIFAHKPSSNVVPGKGRIPYRLQLEEMSVVGPMSKFAKDLRPMLKVLDKSKKLQLDAKVDVNKLRYFYMEDDTNSYLESPIDPVDQETKTALMDVIKYIEKTHGVKVEKVSLPQMKRSEEMWWAKVTEHGGQLWESGKSSGVQILVEAVKCAFGWSQHTMGSVAVSWLQSQVPPPTSQQHQSLIKLTDELSKQFTELLGNDGVFLYPTSSTAALRHGSTIFHAHNFVYTAIFNALKMPATQCHIKQTSDGLPVGIQVVAAPYNDHLTLAVAEELEKAFDGWKPPPSQPKW